MKMNKTTIITRQVLSSKLLVDKYQRPLEDSRVKKIAKNFNPNLVNPIKCSRRKNGQLYIFDGQHTKAVLEYLNGDNPVLLDCRVYEFVGLSDEERYIEEAKLFEEQTGLSKQVTIGSKLKSEYLRGEPRAVEFYNSSNILGLTMDFTRSCGHGGIRCISEALKAWEKLGSELYEDMLHIIVEVWGIEEDALRGEIVGGLATFMAIYGGQYDRKRLVKKLKNKSPMQIIRDGNLMMEVNKRKYAQQILNAYNKGATGRNVLLSVLF